MNKQMIGVFRVAVYLVIVIFFPREFNNFNFKFWISDFLYGSHATEFRSSTAISLIMLLYYGILSFYIIQTMLYIFIGGALTGRKTGLFRFLGLLISGIQEAASAPNFWTSRSGSIQTDQIEKVLQYRDNRMAMMSNEDAVEFSKGTGHVEQMLTRPDLRQNRKVLSYMNNKIAFMDNETALEYLRGQKK